MTNLYRLVHVGSLHALLQPLASVYINNPVGEAKIPARACYQERLPNFHKDHHTMETIKVNKFNHVT